MVGDKGEKKKNDNKKKQKKKTTKKAIKKKLKKDEEISPVYATVSEDLKHEQSVDEESNKKGTRSKRGTQDCKGRCFLFCEKAGKQREAITEHK